MSTRPQHLAIYGKGGIGKSTTTSNIAAALAEAGYKVVQIGCDPKSDSTNTLRGGAWLNTVLDRTRDGSAPRLEDIAAVGYRGVICVEAGGPVPGVGCAGRGINAAISLLHELHLFEEAKPDVVLYDVLGDVVCGGFAVPIREGLTDRVYVVSSADFMAVYAANNLFRAINKYAPSGGARLGGLIANSIQPGFSRPLIDDFAARTGTRAVEYVPRSPTVAQSELCGRTVIEAAPASPQADVYRALARTIVEDTSSVIPKPLAPAELRQWARDWGDLLLRDGAPQPAAVAA
ncbi:nucleotide-binding protein [Rubrivivax gelatinosus]|uniref:Nitrogenase iron protein NifH n=1 Tax=Rubrivivax gelatinosus (strain NBRC 100245 / IL144) TaxID=983917 RepID=I0HS97_RUBGI|nr:nitrogenase iron protein NifH [Rubrivivax gelatinosus]MBG6082413.1 nitrogenase iron protein NifH [Rubrivivax gelatinosus]BAL95884.1 nitrogenase iron protein NifH [Rubrivivax gelatinosus IL144]